MSPRNEAWSSARLSKSVIFRSAAIVTLRKAAERRSKSDRWVETTLHEPAVNVPHIPWAIMAVNSSYSKGFLRGRGEEKTPRATILPYSSGSEGQTQLTVTPRSGFEALTANRIDFQEKMKVFVAGERR